MADMRATTEVEIHELLATRWSPYSFADKPVSVTELKALFEAARWAPSCFNEQPWRFIVATREQPEEFSKLLSCLTEGNQAWARTAPVLALGVISLRFARNNKENRTAGHDLGLAVANLTVEATARGLCVHQMAGLMPDAARAAYGIPEDYAAWTAMAIGYAGDPAALPENLRERDRARRPRMAQKEFVFAGAWERTAWFVASGGES